MLTGESCDATWTLSTLGAVTTCVRAMLAEEGVVWRDAVTRCRESGAEIVSIQTTDKFLQIRNLIDDMGWFITCNSCKY